METPVGNEAVLLSPTRRAIIDRLDELRRSGATTVDRDGRVRDPGLSAGDVGRVLELHVTTARFHLDRLEQAGLVESFVAGGGRHGRPSKLYALSLRGRPSPEVRPQLLLAQVLVEAWGPAGSDSTPEEAGVAWAHRHLPTRTGLSQPPAAAATPGEFLGKVGVLVDTLREWGYAPQVQTSRAGRTATLTLVDCPFRDLAKTRSDVVCAVHRGIIRGLLDVLGEPEAQAMLDPLVGGTHCIAQISTRVVPDARAPDGAAPQLFSFALTPEEAPTHE
ncbi:MAG: helix-turn-helix domain-containing protein [Dermatophilaceae bacterium]